MINIEHIAETVLIYECQASSFKGLIIIVIDTLM